MKILMMASGTPHSSLTHRIVALGRELVARGHEVTMIAPSFDKHSHWKLDNPATMDGITMVYPVQFRTRSFLLNLLPYVVSAGLEVLRRRYDVLYLYKPTPITIVGVLARLVKRRPVVLDMDDLGSEVMRIEGQPKLIWRLVELCERLAARQARAIVAASRLLEGEFRARFPRKTVLRLPNGVDPQEFTPAAGTSERPVRIVFFGMLSRTRIVAPLIEALPEVIERVGREAVAVEILGDGPCRGELEALADRLGVSANITFRGWTTFEQLGEYAAEGDIAICVMPDERTTAACSNQKVFQYMALGLSPIVSRVGDLPLYVEDGQAGLVVPASDSAALAEAIVELMGRPEKRQALAKRARHLAETRYAWSILAGQLESLLEKVR
jgi:glycosyltransferase involved in cell wall biosynthesis